MKFAVTHSIGAPMKNFVYLFETEKEAKEFLEREFERKVKEYITLFGEDSILYGKSTDLLVARIDWVWEDKTSSTMDEYWFGVVGDPNSPS